MGYGILGHRPYLRIRFHHRPRLLRPRRRNSILSATSQNRGHSANCLQHCQYHNKYIDSAYAESIGLGLERQNLLHFRWDDIVMSRMVLVPPARTDGSDIHGVGYLVREEGQGTQV